MTTKWIPKIELHDDLRYIYWSCEKCGYVRSEGWEHTYNGKKPKVTYCENCGRKIEN